jgi:hypothetical protein
MANFSGDVSLGARYSPVSFPSGAGRIADMVWPDPLQMVSTASSVTQARNRLYNTQLAFATGGFGGGAATLNLLAPSVFGQLAIRLAGGASDGIGQIARANLPCPPLFQVQGRTTSGVNSSDYQPFAAFRVYAVYALSSFGTAGANQDCGLELTTGGGLIQSQSTKGIAFGRSAQGVIIARSQTVGGGAGSSVAVTGPGTTFPTFDESLMNAYEIQGTSATTSAEATISWLINGRLIRRLSYGAGSLLPTFNGVIDGCWTAMLVNVAKSVNLDTMQLHIIQAPTIQDCY